MVTHSQQIEGEGRAFVIRNKGLLSGKTALIILGIFGFALSVAFPYGLGLMAFAAVIAIVGALCAVGIACYSLMKDMFSRTATFGYAPTTAYMTGAKTKKKRKEDSTEEEERKTE